METLSQKNAFTSPSPSDHYKLLIEDARSLSDRRETINNIFVGVISLLAGAQGYLLVTIPDKLVGLIVSGAAAAFGLGLCSVWANTLKNYKILLDMRYYTLKTWESHFDFPSIQRYYLSEDILYGDIASPTDLSKAIPPKLKGKARNFVSMYVALPRMARILFFALVLLQLTAFLISSFAPQVFSRLPNL